MKNFALISFFLVSSAYAEGERLISVNGSCLKQVTPDRASIQIFAEEREKDLKTALKKSTQVYEKIRNEVKKMGLENLDLTSAEYRLEEVVEWEKDKRVSKGFRARLGLRVESSSMDKMGDVITMATREGATEIGALNTFLSPQTQKKEQFSCLEEATRDAKGKAERLAAGAGSTLGAVFSLNEQTYFPNFPIAVRGGNMKTYSASAESFGSPTVEPGKTELRVTVNAQFLMK